MVTVTKRFKFSYAHFLPHYAGDCANTHGHNAVLEVEVGGQDVSGYPGMVIDFKELKRIVMDVVAMIDHKFLNMDLARFRNKWDWANAGNSFGSIPTPTAENMVIWFVDELHGMLPNGCILKSLRLSETDDAWVTWRLED